VTHAVLRELRVLTELSDLYPGRSPPCDGRGVRELLDLTALDTLDLSHCTHVTDTGLGRHCELGGGVRAGGEGGGA